MNLALAKHGRCTRSYAFEPMQPKHQCHVLAAGQLRSGGHLQWTEVLRPGFSEADFSPDESHVPSPKPRLDRQGSLDCNWMDSSVTSMSESTCTADLPIPSVEGPPFTSTSGLPGNLTAPHAGGIPEVCKPQALPYPNLTTQCKQPRLRHASSPEGTRLDWCAWPPARIDREGGRWEGGLGPAGLAWLHFRLLLLLLMQMIVESTISRSTCSNIRMRSGGTRSQLQCHHDMPATSLKCLKVESEITARHKRTQSS